MPDTKISDLPQPKFCKDCRHFEANPLQMTTEEAQSLARCAASGTPDLVTGEMHKIFCRTARQTWPGACGPEAQFFEPKAV